MTVQKFIDIIKEEGLKGKMKADKVEIKFATAPKDSLEVLSIYASEDQKVVWIDLGAADEGGNNE